MNATSAKADYLLLFRGSDWHAGLSPAEIQDTMTDWMAWFNRLRAEGRCTGGQSLGTETRIVSGQARMVSDGPFTEAKETVAGYFALQVADLEEAVEIARECPTLRFGTTVEIRPMMARCQASEQAREVALETSA
jgi:hypothetical protein